MAEKTIAGLSELRGGARQVKARSVKRRKKRIVVVEGGARVQIAVESLEARRIRKRSKMCVNCVA